MDFWKCKQYFKHSRISPDFHLREIKNGQKTDVFSKAWGTNPDNIKNPEG